MARHPVVDSDHTLPSVAGSEPEPDSTSTRQSLVELDPTVEQPGWLLNTEQVDFVSDEDHLEEDTDADVLQSGTIKSQLVAAARPRTDRAAPRASAFLLIASSVLVLLSGAAAWITLSGSSTTPMTADLACTLSEQSSPCTQTIVTGAIGKAEQPQSREPEPSAAFATHASSEPIPAIEQFQLSAPQKSRPPRPNARMTQRKLEIAWITGMNAQERWTLRQKATHCPLRRPQRPRCWYRKTCLPTGTIAAS